MSYSPDPENLRIYAAIFEKPRVEHGRLRPPTEINQAAANALRVHAFVLEHFPEMFSGILKEVKLPKETEITK